MKKNAPAPIETGLERVERLVTILRAQEAAVAAAEVALADAKAAKLRTAREDLPELLREVGLESVRTSEGLTVTLKDDVMAAIPPDRQSEAFAWLAERGYDGIIKTEVRITFGRGERLKAIDAAAAIEKKFKRPALVAEGVNAQTLKAFVRERMAAGETVPFDLFGIFPYTEAKVTEDRPRKAPKKA